MRVKDRHKGRCDDEGVLPTHVGEDEEQERL